MKANKNALNFARSMNDFDDRMPKGRGDCFDFGQTYGCRADCPVFAEGMCKVEDPDAFVEMIENDVDLTKDDIEEIKKLYPTIEQFKSL